MFIGATDEDVKNLLKSQSLGADDDESEPPTRARIGGAGDAPSISDFINGPPSSSTLGSTTQQQQAQVAIATKPPPISTSTQRRLMCLVGAILSILVPSTTTI